MKVLYVAPRYHTNQIPVMKGWLENGHQVMFISQFAGTSEDYTILHPIVLGYSVLSEIVIKFYKLFFCRGEKSARKEFAFRVKIGFPPIGKARKYIKEFKPQLVIVREYAFYNIPFSLQCKREKIPCILYNQSPLWDEKVKKNLVKGLFYPFFPRHRITPVLGTKNNCTEKIKDAHFVPFVMEPYLAPKQKQHFLNGIIHILCVARYEERKNLFLLLDAIRDLVERYELHLTIIGEVADQNQTEYYDSFKKKIMEYGMDRSVTLYKNFSMKQMYEEYRKADLFVLPSTRERASVAQLEAMSCSLPIICSNTNGTACYVEHGVNGFLFQDNDVEDLTDKIKTLVSNRETLLCMGQKSYEYVLKKYQFSEYFNKIINLMEGGL